MSRANRVGGVVLCGGRSRRMGRPKVWLRFGPERLLERVIRQVAVAVDPVILVAGPEQELPEVPAGTRVVRDATGGLGPLAGLLTGLLELPEDVEWVYVTGVDSPFLAEGWVARLMALSEGMDLVLPRQGGYAHPLAAVYRRNAALAAAESLIETGARRLLDLARRVRTLEIEAESLRAIDPELLTLRNLNTLADYQWALVRAGFEPSDAAGSGSGAELLD